MNLGEIEALARTYLDDEAGQELWSAAFLRGLGNEAQNEANLRARYLVESANPRVCQITLVAGQAEYSLHPAIIVARRFEFVPAQTGWQPITLRRTTFDALDHEDPHWTGFTGRPTAVVLDLQRGRFRLDRTPTVDTLGTIKLTAWRRPLDSELLEEPGDEPVIPADQHPELVHWILHKAYMRKDAETFDRDLSDRHLQTFEAYFGPRPTAAQIRAMATDHDGEIHSYFY